LNKISSIIPGGIAHQYLNSYYFFKEVMMTHEPPSGTAPLNNLVRIIGSISIAVGALSAIGWIFSIGVLTSILPHWQKMAPLTAVTLILSGFALIFTHARATSPASERLARILSSAILLVGVSKLADAAVGLGFDRYAFSARLAPATALNFVLLGTALLLAPHTRFFRIFQLLAILVGVGGWLGVSHYIYGGTPLKPYSEMAAHTAGTFLLLSIGALFLRPDLGLAMLMISDTAGGKITRRLIPAVFLSVLLGWLRIQAQQAGWVDTEVGLSIFALANIMILGGLVWNSAAMLHRTDEDRKKAEAQVAQGEAARARLAAIVDSSADAIIGKDLNSIITSWNTGAETLFGFSASEMVGTSILRLIPVDRQNEEILILDKIKRGESLEHFETLRQTKDKRLIEVSVTASPILNSAGIIIGVSKIARDITERRHAQAALHENEERFRTMANSMPQLAWIAKPDGFIYWYNQRWYDYTGTTPQQMEGWGWQSVHDPVVLPTVLEKWKIAISTGQPFEMEFPLRGADGLFHSFLTRCQPLKDSKGKISHWFGTNTDIDKLKRVEESLRDTQTRLHSTLAAGSIGTWSWDIPNDRLVADEFTARVFSLEPVVAAKGLPAEIYLRAIHEEDQPAVRDALARAIQICGFYDIEYRVLQKDGEILWMQARGRVQGEAGKAVNFHGAVMDITANKRAQETIRSSEVYFRFLNDLIEATRMLADAGQIMAVTSRMLGEHLHVSRCAYADVKPDGEKFTILHDYTDGCASTVGNYQLSLFGPKAVATLKRGETLVIRNVDSELLPHEGADMFNAIDIKAIITCPLVKEGALRALMAVHQTTPRDWNASDVTFVRDVVERCWSTIERRNAEGKIRESESRYRTLFNYAPDGIVIANPESYYIDANASMCRMLGYTHKELVGLHASDIVAQAEIPQINPALQAIKADSNYNREWQFRRKDGSLFLAEVMATQMPDGNLLGMIRDITANRNLEKQLHQTQKMEAVGLLAGGIAHDFNNLLTVINGRSMLAMNRFNVGDKSRSDLEMIYMTGERAAALTRQLLAFSRQQVLEPVVLDLNAVTAEMNKLLRRLIREDIDLTTVLDPALKCVKADPGQIEQVIMNLVVNARDAMPGKGRLTIETTNVELNETYCRSHPEVKPGQYVMLAVSDTGHGMDAAVKAKVFEPFYTTKPQGKGTGLGLSTVFGVIKQSNGFIEVYSEVDKGTTFKIYLPQTREKPVISTKAAHSLVAPKGQEVILVVEDEDGVRELFRDLLEMNGYTVLSANNGVEALKLLHAHKTPIHLLITDVVMPEMGGPELVERMHSFRPEIKFLYTSGYTEHAVIRNGALESGVAFIQKPFTPASLARKVREVIDM